MTKNIVTHKGGCHCKEIQFEGIAAGKITKELSGEDGFGYDPVFLPNGYDKTL